MLTYCTGVLATPSLHRIITPGPLISQLQRLLVKSQEREPLKNYDFQGATGVYSKKELQAESMALQKTEGEETHHPDRASWEQRNRG